MQRPQSIGLLSFPIFLISSLSKPETATVEGGEAVWTVKSEVESFVSSRTGLGQQGLFLL